MITSAEAERTWYSFAVMQSMVSKRVRRAPRRMVPPLCVLLPSGMNTTAGQVVAESNSVLLASRMPHTLRAYSMTATC